MRSTLLFAGPAGCLAAGLAAPAAAGEVDRFVESNLLAALYHEIGHAVIDGYTLPIYASEEDAADTFSALLIHAWHDEAEAMAMVRDTALAFRGEDALRVEDGQELAFWSIYAPDLQRAYDAVCLVYGAAPERRAALLSDPGLPDERAQFCADEFDLAWSSWEPVLDDLATLREVGEGSVPSLDIQVALAPRIERALVSAVTRIGGAVHLPMPVRIEVALCGEANAFYDYDHDTILMCREYIDHFAVLAEVMGIRDHTDCGSDHVGRKSDRLRRKDCSDDR
ncbi:hypothetical protein DXV76_16150 [Rhodobacteraceae bacterium CCMM004]|nr:hypothetical protein DXV76_16150 [Rhodobacteraceae bacterium CCMM004]